MEDIRDKIVTVKNGRFKGEEFRIEDDINDMEPRMRGGTDLPTLAMRGNWAAKNALQIDKYTIDDAPFYYGKIGALGYVISKHDLGL
ncbi:MAG: hypothetical protein KJI69_05180 [Patescibacteria group bacterium]|nr:hypothetical protein [Patescibacteria group bacterium]